MKLVLDFLLIAGLILTAIVLVLLFVREEREPSHKVLLIIFASIFITFLSYYAYLHRIGAMFFATFVVSNSIDVYIGPLFLFYVQSVSDTFEKSLKAILPHLVFPVLYILGISLPSVAAMAIDSFEPAYLDQLFPYVLFTMLYSFGYCLYALFKLRDFQKLVKQHYSNLENKNLDWIKRLLLGVLGIMVIGLSTSVYEVYAGDQGWDIDFLTVIPIVFLVAYMGYYGISQSSILLPGFLRRSLAQNPDVLVGESKDASLNYTYDPTEMKNLAERLHDAMNIEKPYLKEDLTLTTLARFLQVPDKKLSTVLNQNMDTSFYDFINSHRVEEVKKRMSLQGAEKYTLLAIAYECGFKSKSSFNRIFKKMTSQSPSEYRKNSVKSLK